MIAKGLDFPNVTLVGVINADTALHLPDFRAAERSFSLVTQVAGRTGRGARGGRVLVQTFNPENAAIVAATRHDYLGFARNELPQRKMFGYPPFGFQARIVIRSESDTRADHMAENIAKIVKQSAEELKAPINILGPSVAPMEKLRGKYRFHMLLSTAEPNRLQQVLTHADARIKPVDGVQYAIDIDPQDMM
jgi:primosomal protein N' (replication factor Y)